MVRIAVVVLLCTFSLAQAQTVVPDGTEIVVELNENLTSQRARTGDMVKLRVATDVSDAAGKVLLARGTKVSGRVALAVPLAKKRGTKAPSKLGVVIEAVVVRGVSVPLRAYLDGCLRPPPEIQTIGQRAPVPLSIAGLPNNNNPAISVTVGPNHYFYGAVEKVPDRHIRAVVSGKGKDVYLPTGTSFTVRTAHSD
jgi:hypothetical protein